MDMISFKEEVLRLIAFRQEGEYWDFKKEWMQLLWIAPYYFRKTNYS